MLSTVLKCTGAVVGIMILVVGFRESTLRGRVQAAEKQRWAKALDDAVAKSNEAIAKQTPRSIGQEEIKRFVAATMDAPKGPVTVHVYYNESEPSGYARQIRGMLNDAGYLIGSESGFSTSLTPPKKPELGQFLAVSSLANPPLFARRLQDALEAIGIRVGGREGSIIPEGEVRIYVGKKPE